MIYVSIYFVIENSIVSKNMAVGICKEVAEKKPSSVCLLKIHLFSLITLVVISFISNWILASMLTKYQYFIFGYW